MKYHVDSTEGYSRTRYFLQIFALCTMVLAKPVFDILASHPEYLVVNQVQPASFYVFIFAISLLLPLTLTLLVESMAFVSPRILLVARSVLVGLLLGIFALQLVGRWEFLAPRFVAISAVVVSILIAAGTILIYQRTKALLLVLVVLSPVGILFPALFLSNPDLRNAVHTKPTHLANSVGIQATSVESKPPIIIMVFDEFSLVDLLDSNGDIDANRYPNFANLASTSTWYSNATTVHYSTTWAIPAILTGRHPKDHALPRYDHYPENIFSLLGGHYHFHVAEPVTELYRDNRLSPDKSTHEQHDTWTLFEDMGVVWLHFTLPEEYRQHLPPIGSTWGGFLQGGSKGLPPIMLPDNDAVVTMDEEERKLAKLAQEKRLFKHLTRDDRLQYVLTFNNSISTHPHDTLHFLHVLLPHRPSIYLPSGHIYSSGQVDGVYEEPKEKSWAGPQHLVDRLHQAHLLQTGLVDTLVGHLVTQMKLTGIYDESLLIIVADHGVSFQKSVSNRRPRSANYGDLAFVPLFIKYPYQQEGKLDKSNVETIDVLPTIVDVIGADTNWELDGRSLIDERAIPKPRKIFKGGQDIVFSYSEEEYLLAKSEAFERNRKTFYLNDTRADLYRYGPGLNLVGRPVSELELAKDCSVDSSSLELLLHMRNNPKYQPLHFQGTVNCSEVDPASLFVVGIVNGSVEIAVKPYSFKGTFIFDFVFPASALQKERSEIGLLLVADDQASQQNS